MTHEFLKYVLVGRKILLQPKAGRKEEKFEKSCSEKRLFSANFPGIALKISQKFLLEVSQMISLENIPPITLSKNYLGIIENLLRILRNLRK